MQRARDATDMQAVNTVWLLVRHVDVDYHCLELELPLTGWRRALFHDMLRCVRRG
jgi:hypothetical protein